MKYERIKLLKNKVLSDDWNRESHPYVKQDFGHWDLVLPPGGDGQAQIKHGSILKVSSVMCKILRLDCVLL